MNREKLAVHADLSMTTVRNYELGITAPSIESIRRIARATGVDVLWLIDGDREEVAS